MTSHIFATIVRYRHRRHNHRSSLLGLVFLPTIAFAQMSGAAKTSPGAGPKFTGLQYAVAQGGLGSPSGAMSGYAAGDTITLQCSGVEFSTTPVIGVTSVSNGVITGSTVTVTGVTTGAVAGGSTTCSQASTSGSGSGYNVTVTLGVIAAYLSIPSLQGSMAGGGDNGNFYLNWGSGDGTFFATSAGVENTFIGDKAGIGFTGEAQESTAVGHDACGNGDTGGAGVANGFQWTCIGNDAGRNISGTGGGGTLVGQGAGRNIANRWGTWIGFNAGGNNGANSPGLLSGVGNTGVGYDVGSSLTSGGGNLFLGSLAGDSIGTGNNDIILNATTASSDSCDTGNVSNTLYVCLNAGPSLTISGGSTPSTSTFSIAGRLSRPAATGLTGAGTTQAGATAITTTVAVLTSCASGNTAFVLPPSPSSGSIQEIVFNRSGSACLIFPSPEAAIEGNGSNMPVSVEAGTDTTFTSTSATQWYQ